MDVLTRLDACAECEQATLAPLLTDAAAEIRKLRNSPVAEMLCSVMKEIEGERLLEIVTPEVRAWWEEHKNRDADKRAP